MKNKQRLTLITRAEIEAHQSMGGVLDTNIPKQNEALSLLEKKSLSKIEAGAVLESCALPLAGC